MYAATLALWPSLEPLLPAGASFNYKRLLLGWISTESGGNIKSIGSASLGEGGYFQLTRSDYARLALMPLDHLQSLQAGISFVEEQTPKAVDFLAFYDISGDEEFVLKVVRLFHAGGPGMAHRMFDDMRANESLPAEFSEISEYFGSTKGIHNEADMRTRISTSEGYLYASTQCYRVEKTWSEGAAIAVLLELVPDMVTSALAGPILAINDIFNGNFDLVGLAVTALALVLTFLLLRKWYRRG